uniref:Mitochondrial thiamine pyrophosphate carrier n=1 Tax=Cacopsylla melanoneura TaxID=428564 RepID=A0A8D8RY59_9HEMI
MVVGHDETKNIATYKYVLAGGFSGAVTRAVCQPFDVLKIRFQLQVESFDRLTGGKYRGLPQALSTIVREEGVSALWKGHVPAQSLSVVYGCVQFLSFEFLSSQMSPLIPKEFHMSSDFFIGTFSSVIATVVSFPFDVIRTRLVAQGNQTKVYSGTLHALLVIYKDKPLTLFRGLTPGIIQMAPQGGIQFSVYNAMSNVLSASEHFSSSPAPASSSDPQTVERVLSPLGSLLAGSVAGLTAKVAVYPLDLAKKRIQVQGLEEARTEFGKTLQCQSLFECLYKTWRTESLRGLYKGLSPSLLKAGLTTACLFTVYEQTLRLLTS